MKNLELRFFGPDLRQSASTQMCEQASSEIQSHMQKWLKPSWNAVESCAMCICAGVTRSAGNDAGRCKRSLEVKCVQRKTNSSQAYWHAAQGECLKIRALWELGWTCPEDVGLFRIKTAHRVLARWAVYGLKLFPIYPIEAMPVTLPYGTRSLELLLLLRQGRRLRVHGSPAERCQEWAGGHSWQHLQRSP